MTLENKYFAVIKGSVNHLITIDKCEDIEHGRNVWMVVAGSFFEIFKRLLAKRYGHFVP